MELGCVQLWKVRHTSSLHTCACTHSHTQARMNKEEGAQGACFWNADCKVPLRSRMYESGSFFHSHGSKFSLPQTKKWVWKEKKDHFIRGKKNKQTKKLWAALSLKGYFLLRVSLLSCFLDGGSIDWTFARNKLLKAWWRGNCKWCKDKHKSSVVMRLNVLKRYK